MSKGYVVFEAAMGDNATGTMVKKERRVGQIAFEMFGYQWIVHSEREETYNGDVFRAWEITERTTGRRIPFPDPCLNKADAIARAKTLLTEKGEEQVKAAMASIQ